jgi:hypothetical protein
MSNEREVGRSGVEGEFKFSKGRKGSKCERREFKVLKEDHISFSRTAYTDKL